MAENLQCPQCGDKLPPDAPLGLCPKCVLNLAAETRQETQPESRPAADGSSWTAFVPPAPEELAASFPQLEVLELLGQGGMGAVYKARQPSLDRLVALKILRPSLGADPAFAERFAREARSLARLNHPNIVGVYDFGQAGGFYYLLMEYVDGVNLRHMAGRAPVASKEALAIVPQICDALQYAHDEGIVHRDIKPENILIDTKGRVKIADFGLAKLLARTPADVTLTQPQQVMGTLHYMAPEQVEHPATVDQRADIYSLGVVFYELLTGELPIGRFDAPSKRVEIDVRLDEVVLKTLEKEPDRRYQQVSQVKTDVEHISSTAILPAPAGAPAGETPPTRRSLWLRAMLLVRLTAWTGLLLAIFGIGLPSAWDAWWPHVYYEEWQIPLAPQSGAYDRVSLGAKRQLHCWGEGRARELFAKRPWTGIATIERSAACPTATLELDSFHEEWRWTIPFRKVTRFTDEPQPEAVAELMKAAGIDTTKPGVQAEAAELIRLVKEVSSGLLPGGRRPVERLGSSIPSGTKFGPFTSEDYGGYITRSVGTLGLREDNALGVLVVLFLAIWILVMWITVRRHHRRLAAAHETEPRYRLGTVGFWALIISFLGGAPTDLPWVRLGGAWGNAGPGGALRPSLNWYGNVTTVAFLAVFLVCFLTDFFGRGRRWQRRIMVVAGTVVLTVTSIIFWGLTLPVRLEGGRLTTVGCWGGVDVRDVGSRDADWVARNIQQNSGPGLWIALAMGLALLVLGGLAILWARRQGAGQRRVCRRGAARADVEANTDEKAEQIDTNGKSNIGKISLILAIGGAVLPILITVVLLIVESLTGFNPPYVLCFFLSIALEIAALVTGIIGRGSACGKAGLIIAAILLVLEAVVGLVTPVEDFQTFTESSEGPVTTGTTTYANNNWEGVITKTGVEIDSIDSSGQRGTSLKVVADSDSPTVVRLFETGSITHMFEDGMIDVDNSRIIYWAHLRAFRLKGQAYLEMHCHFPDGRESVHRSLDMPVSGTKDWTSVETSVVLKGDKEPDNVKLNLVIEGKGAVWIDIVSLTLQHPANAASAREAHRGVMVDRAPTEPAATQPATQPAPTTKAAKPPVE